MSEKISTLYVKGDTSTIIRPNIVSSNIPAEAVTYLKTTYRTKTLKEWAEAKGCDDDVILFIQGVQTALLEGSTFIYFEQVDDNTQKVVSPVSVEVVYDSSDNQSCYVDFRDTINGTSYLYLDYSDAQLFPQDLDNNYYPFKVAYWG